MRIPSRTFILFALISQMILPLDSIADDGDEKLPSDAKLLMRKLAEFEKEERLKFEENVSEKRKQVVEALATYLEKETKSGNLEGAIAVKKVMELLQTPEAALPNDEAPAKEHEGAPEKDWYLERTWGIENFAQAYTFKPDGVVWKSVNGQTTETSYKWTLLKSGALEIRGENEPMYFWLDSSVRGEKTAMDQRIDGLKLERRK